MYYLQELQENAGIFSPGMEKEYIFPLSANKFRVNILAMGSVGSSLLTGLVLLGGDIIHSIGIFDIKQNVLNRYEAEMNQVAGGCFPKTEIIESEDGLFGCDVFLFCAAKEVPELTSGVNDVRMAQYAENKILIEHYAKIAAAKSFGGLFAVVSDPVDPLCKTAYLTSGLNPGQFRGFGLGVMNGRALYYARKEKKYSRYVDEGRVFGPHGEDLVVADSILNYDDDISRELTEKVVTENIRIRRMGFKPFIAPAISSGAVSVLRMLRGEWHYSSNFIGTGREGAFFGALNRITERKCEFETDPLPAQLFERIEHAYENLKKID